MSSPNQQLIPCSLCNTFECTQQSNTDQISDEMPSKTTIGVFNDIPNEMISSILKNLSLKQLSQFSTFNKWFRDFILKHFINSKIGLKSLLSPYLLATDCNTEEQQKQRLELFSQFGILLKRVTCLIPTSKRIEILIKIFDNLDGIPNISSNPMNNKNMRFIFQSYGRIIHKLTAGWDDSELIHVFESLLNLTKMDKNLRTIEKSSVGTRIPFEYYIRCFYRMLCVEPNPSEEPKEVNDNIFWLKRSIKGHKLSFKARLLLIIYGPLISFRPAPINTPHIGYWDLTDTFFINHGLEELGFALYLLYSDKNSVEHKNSVVKLMAMVMNTPQNWLFENMAALMFYAGDDITYDFLFSQIEMGNYTEVSKYLVYLSLVSYKLSKKTKCVYYLIKKLAQNEHKSSLLNEIPIAFVEAVTEVENAIELEEERDFSEVHDVIEANNDLLKNFMLKPTDESDCSLTPNSSQEVEE